MPVECARIKRDVDSVAPLAWRQTLVYPKPALQVAIIQSDTDDILIDDQGRYYVRPLFDIRSRAPGKSSHAVRLMQPSAGPPAKAPQGMHLPLMANTCVVLAHLHHQIDKPIILGVLPGLDQKTTVSAENHSELVLRHGQNIALEFDDTLSVQYLKLYTEKGRHGLFLEKHLEAENITARSLGLMDLVSGQDVSLLTGHDLIIRSEQHQFHAAQELSLVAKEHMSWRARKNATYSSGNDWQLLISKGALTLSSKRRFKAEGDRVSIQPHSLEINSEYGEVYAGKSLIINGMKCLELGVHFSKLVLSKSVIELQAPHISLVAQEIIKTQG